MYRGLDAAALIQVTAFAEKARTGVRVHFWIMLSGRGFEFRPDAS
jgi:hypothetical protein